MICHNLNLFVVKFFFVLSIISHISIAATAKMNNLRPLAFTLSHGKANIQKSFKAFPSPSLQSSRPSLIGTSTTRLFGCKRGTPGNPPGTIDFFNEQTTIPDIDRAKIELTISTIRDIIGYPTYDVSVILTEDEEMQQTNLETRGVDKPTDILSFQFQDVVDEPGTLGEPDFDIPEYYNLGDLMIDVPYVIRRCEEDREFNEGDSDEAEIEVDEDDDYVGDDDRGVSGVMATIYDPQQRIQLLLVHGMLHLVGYDHIEDDEYDVMVTKEEEVIKELQKRLNENWCDVE